MAMRKGNASLLSIFFPSIHQSINPSFRLSDTLWSSLGKALCTVSSTLSHHCKNVPQQLPFAASEQPMPSVTPDGHDCIGKLRIPVLPIIKGCFFLS